MPRPVHRRVEEIDIVLVGEQMLAELEQWLRACERCEHTPAISLDYLLDAIMGRDPQTTEYVMCRPARCPVCSSEVNEKTGVVV